MFAKEKAKGSPRQHYFLWLGLGLGIGMLAVLAGFIGLFEPRRDMEFSQIASIQHDDYPAYSYYSPDNQYIFTYSRINGFRSSDTTGREISHLNEDAINFEMLWNPDQTHFLMTDYQQNALLFDKSGHQVTAYEHSGIYYAHWNTTGSRIVTQSESELRLWTIEGTMLQSFPQPIAYYDALQWSPDGSRWALWQNEREGGIYDADGKIITQIELAGYISAYTWSSDSSRFAIAQYHSDDPAIQTISIYDREGTLLWSEDVHMDALQLLWSPDGSRLIATDYYAGKAKLWSLEGEMIAELDFDTILQWHPDGEILLVGSPEGRDLRYLDKNGQLLYTLPHSAETRFTSPQWSPDGKYLASWTNQLEDGYSSLWLWDLQGNLLHEFRESSPISFAYWSPDSSRILSVGGFVARLWSVAGGEINSLNHSQPIYYAQWSSDGSRILTIGSYGSMLIENAVWTSEGEHLATLFTGESSESYVQDWRDDLGQVLVQHNTSVGIYNLQPGSIYFDFRFDNQ